jgi:hypothetical protein
MGGMNADWLSQLAPAHAPPPPGWWPPAPGWWGVALLLILLLAALVYAWRRRPAPRPRRIALRELDRLETLTDDTELARALQDLLRRYAVAAYGRATVAGLDGAAWLAFVVERGGTELAGESGRALLRTAYGGPAGAERERWLKGARGFLGRRP